MKHAYWTNERGERIAVRIIGKTKPIGAYEGDYVRVQKATATGNHGLFAVRRSDLFGISEHLTDAELADCGLLSELFPR